MKNKKATKDWAQDKLTIWYEASQTIVRSLNQRDT